MENKVLAIQKKIIIDINAIIQRNLDFKQLISIQKGLVRRQMNQGCDKHIKYMPIFTSIIENKQVPSIFTENLYFEEESSGSISLNEEHPIVFPKIKDVAEAILSDIQYPILPITQVMKTKPPRSNLIIFNVPIFLQLSQFKEFLSSLPIKGFIQDIKPIYFNTKPSLNLTLKTNQPTLITAQLAQKQYQKQIKLMIGNEFSFFQVDQSQANIFFGVIVRGLDLQFNLDDLQSILEQKIQSIHFDFSKSEILDIKRMGCTVLYFKSLMECISVCKQINNQSLQGLYDREIKAHIHPLTKKRFQIPELFKMNEQMIKKDREKLNEYNNRYKNSYDQIQKIQNNYDIINSSQDNQKITQAISVQPPILNLLISLQFPYTNQNVQIPTPPLPLLSQNLLRPNIQTQLLKLPSLIQPPQKLISQPPLNIQPPAPPLPRQLNLSIILPPPPQSQSKKKSAHPNPPPPPPPPPPPSEI